ncbi:MAG: helix-turn-helix transcriptional regulator, partial [Clostridia bacterium]|nr:helix-turn-helix transcriptional regulator [Clostridia bacterium]
MDTLSKTFAENLMHYRIQRGKKQKDLAMVLDVSAATVSSWESGTYSPKLSTLCKISAYLEVPVDVLLGLDRDSVD